MIAGTTFGGLGMEPSVPEPPVLYERFTVTYPSGTGIESFYAGGATLPTPLAPPDALQGFALLPRLRPRAVLLKGSSIPARDRD